MDKLTRYIISRLPCCIIPVLADKKADARSRVDREADNHQLLQLEEKDVVSSVATVLSDLCGPGEWMPMEKLHAEVSSVACFSVDSFADVIESIFVS